MSLINYGKRKFILLLSIALAFPVLIDKFPKIVWHFMARDNFAEGNKAAVYYVLFTGHPVTPLRKTTVNGRFDRLIYRLVFLGISFPIGLFEGHRWYHLRSIFGLSSQEHCRQSWRTEYLLSQWRVYGWLLHIRWRYQTEWQFRMQSMPCFRRLYYLYCPMRSWCLGHPDPFFKKDWEQVGGKEICVWVVLLNSSFVQQAIERNFLITRLFWSLE